MPPKVTSAAAGSSKATKRGASFSPERPSRRDPQHHAEPEADANTREAGATPFSTPTRKRGHVPSRANDSPSWSLNGNPTLSGSNADDVSDTDTGKSRPFKWITQSMPVPQTATSAQAVGMAAGASSPCTPDGSRLPLLNITRLSPSSSVSNSTTGSGAGRPMDLDQSTPCPPELRRKERRPPPTTPPAAKRPATSGVPAPSIPSTDPGPSEPRPNSARPVRLIQTRRTGGGGATGSGSTRATLDGGMTTEQPKVGMKRSRSRKRDLWRLDGNEERGGGDDSRSTTTEQSRRSASVEQEQKQAEPESEDMDDLVSRLHKSRLTSHSSPKRLPPPPQKKKRREEESDYCSNIRNIQRRVSDVDKRIEMFKKMLEYMLSFQEFGDLHLRKIEQLRRVIDEEERAGAVMLRQKEEKERKRKRDNGGDGPSPAGK
jgi:hypothetical protein